MFDKLRGKQKQCRKCGEKNPASNIYCKNCGAILDVDTAEVKAQPRPVMPPTNRISWPWVLLGILVSLGMLSVLVGLAVFRGVIELNNSTFTSSEGSLVLQGDFLGFVVLMGLAFMISFAISGVAIAWLARRILSREMAIACFLVLALLGMVGSALTADAAVLAGILLVPSAIAAALGARLGGLVSRGDRSS